MQCKCRSLPYRSSVWENRLIDYGSMIMSYDPSLFQIPPGTNQVDARFLMYNKVRYRNKINFSFSQAYVINWMQDTDLVGSI